MKGIVLVVGVSVVLAVAGARFQNTICDINVWDGEDRSQHDVPEVCHGGTFRWNYPHGSTYLHFLKQQASEMMVCISNVLGGTVFTVRDVTHGIGMPFVIGKIDSCSLKSNGSIMLKIDAPPDTFVLFGILDYTVKY